MEPAVRRVFFATVAGFVVIALGVGMTVLSWIHHDGDVWIPTPWGDYGGSDLFDLVVFGGAVAVMFVLSAIWARLVGSVFSKK